MKKENIELEHCPYCKRHCSLNNPRCGKGKALSKKIMIEKRKSETSKSVSSADEKRKKLELKDTKQINSVIQVEKHTEYDERLSDLFYECLITVENQKGLKSSKKKKRLYILSLLIEKGDMTYKELVDCTKDNAKELDKHLLKMKKKGYINWEQGDLENSKISITESALLLWKSKQRDFKKNKLNFSVLEHEEKEYLEKILTKLYTNWNEELK